MNEICRKDSLARNMNRMLKLFPKDYNIFPKTWCLPAESVSPCNVAFIAFFLVLTCPSVITLHSHSDFQAYTRAKKNKSYICKPDTGCQGKGIFITKSYKDIPQEEHMICQVYISRVSVCSATHSINTQPDKHVFNVLCSLSLLMDTSLICGSTSW